MEYKEAIRAIKERLNIVDIVRRYVELKRNGPRWVAPCPFHQETKPSFYVNEEQGSFICFGCHASGDIFEFYSKMNGLDFSETLAALAAEAHVVIDARGRRGPDAAEARKRREGQDKKQLMLRMHDYAASWFAQALNASSAAKCRAYVQERGLSSEIQQHFGLGWADSEWSSLCGALERAGFPLDIATEAGLLARSDKGRVYDRFRSRLIFPIRSLANHIIAFGGRIIEKKDDEAKYINSSDTPIYKKGEHLYGLAQARRGIRAQGRAMLTEGYMDVLTLHQFGYANAVGVLGTALTPDQVKRLSGFTSNLLMLFDGDGPGRKAALKACEMVLTRGLACRVVLLPEGDDIDSFLRTAGRDAFDRLQDEAPDGFAFCMAALRDQSPKDAIDWAHAFLKQISLPELASYYISRLAAQLQLSEKDLRQGFSDWHRHRGRNSPGTGTAPSAQDSAQSRNERQILMFAVRYPDRLDDLRGIGADLALKSPRSLRFWAKLQKGVNSVCELDEREKAFWTQCRREDTAPPMDSCERELDALKLYLNSWYLSVQKASVSAALRDRCGKDDFDEDLRYLQALQTTLEQKK